MPVALQIYLVLLHLFTVLVCSPHHQLLPLVLLLKRHLALETNLQIAVLVCTKQ